MQRAETWTSPLVSGGTPELLVEPVDGLHVTDEDIDPHHECEQRQEEDHTDGVSPVDHLWVRFVSSDAFPKQEDHVSAVQNGDWQEIEDCKIDAEEAEEHEEIDEASIGDHITDFGDAEWTAE